MKDHDPTLNEPRPRRRRDLDPDMIRQQRLDDAWQFHDRDRDDGYEPPPRRSVCIDHTGARFRED